MKIKLIWDFRGQDALKIAQHHAIHLKEFGHKNELAHVCGAEAQTDMHATAWIAVHETDMITVRDALIPHRGEEYEGELG